MDIANYHLSQDYVILLSLLEGDRVLVSNVAMFGDVLIALADSDVILSFKII